MAGNVVIVESPAKAGTIQKFLGEDYIVKSSFGHIRDLQENKLSVDVDNDFLPEYVVPADKKKVVTELRKLSKEAETVWLASDEDREGEAISWHLFETLGLKPENTKRIVFHEITKDAILNAIKNPRDIDMNLVNAQQARRVLDRLVGFEISPVLWRKIQPKLSAGRVQSVALRLVVDREKEILAFRKEQYFKTEGVFRPEGKGKSTKLTAVLDKKFEDEKAAETFLNDSADAVFTIAGIDKKDAVRYPAPPFTTSTLQQEASRKLKFPVSLTMRIAQQLYERGLITYMRTDSTNLSSLALGASKKYIIENFGEEYSHPKQYKTKSKGAQEAHEAIRPTYLSNTEIEGSAQEKKLYALIWKRTIASQMAEAKMLKTDIRIGSDKRDEKFALSASEIIFDGFLKVYMESSDDNAAEEDDLILPELHVGDRLTALSITSESKYTLPASRYSEATLVKKLEEIGIGRPSTYAPTISTLTVGRGYIVKGDKDGELLPVRRFLLRDGVVTASSSMESFGAEKGKLMPQEIGMIVTDYLVDKFTDILDYDFTAKVEKDFDSIAEGKLQWNNVIAEFYSPFHAKVEEVLHDNQYSHVSRELGTDPKDGKVLVAKFGQYGPYIQKGEGEDRQFARLGQGQLIESITLGEALKLFELPRMLGQYEGKDVIATKGKYGPYLKYGDKNVSVSKGTDPLKMTLEDGIAAIEADKNKVAGNSVLAEFDGGKIQVINGRYGPYIKADGKNYKIPKGTDAASLTVEACKSIIDNSEPTRSSGFRRKTGKK